MKIKIPTKVLKATAKVAPFFKKNGHKILFALGAGCMAGGVVVACSETRKLDDILDDTKTSVEALNERKETDDDYSKKEYTVDLAKTYAVTAGRTVKLYSKSIILLGMSIACFGKSNDILAKQAGWASSLLAVKIQEFEDYRKKVAEKYGAEIDSELRYGEELKDVTFKIADEEGVIEEQTVRVPVIDEDALRDKCMFIFKEGDYGWTKDMNYNLLRVSGVENWANNVLISRRNGLMFLNEIRIEFGLDPLPELQNIGWRYDKNKTHQIDFGFESLAVRGIPMDDGEVVMGIIIDPNVDGDIVNNS